jgi:serine/threonine protein kinase
MEAIIFQVAVKVLQARTHDSQLEKKISKVMISWCSYQLRLFSCCCGPQRIRREIAIWQGLKHENVLPLLGITSDFGRYMSLVSPWLENGSLMQYLDKNRDTLGVTRRLQLVSRIY